VSAVDALVDLLPRTTLIVGKGGVGKSTCAAALALRVGSAVETLLLSTDPARALPSVLGQPIGSAPTPVKGVKRLAAQLLDASGMRGRFLDRWGDVIRMIVDRGTYLDDADIGPLVDTALPGSDEIFSALRLAELMTESRSGVLGAGSGATDTPHPTPYSRVIVDTAPTGHTLRLLNLPRTFRALVRLLDAMQAKHRFMVRTLTHAYRTDQADAFLGEMNQLVSTLDDSLRDPSRCVAVMVTNSQSLVLDETRRYLAALRDLRITVGVVVWNAADNAATLDVDAAQYVVPRLDEPPVGRKGLESWMGSMRPATAAARTRTSKRARPRSRQMLKSGKRRGERGNARIESILRGLTIVAGKGGVGKTTVAAALAIDAAERYTTLVVSTDPAPSLGDALAQEIPDADTPVEGASRLMARQMDASAAFERLRSEYQSRVDALFDALVAKGVNMTHDRAIVRDLLALAPPGVDEVYALSLLSDALFKDRYERVIVDPAPTGHLLRLLEMPQLALLWTHQLMRLMLKYKDVAGLGETAEELLAFARNLRAVDSLLRDQARCALVLVTLDEPVVRAETERLFTEVRNRGVSVTGVILNRASYRRAALPVTDAPMHFEAPAAEPSPIGVVALRRWAESWVGEVKIDG